MPHQCVRCGTFYDDGASEILSGCKCGARLFFYVKKEKLEEAKEISTNLTKKEKKKIEDSRHTINLKKNFYFSNLSISFSRRSLIKDF